nr:hypothetical protein GCM10020063_093960 [Dactylosporangium thailandense]
MTTSLLRTAAWALVYLLATVAGRKTIMDGSSLSLVWPAAGVSVLWFAAQRKARVRWADPVALAVITLVVNLATGATPLLALWFVVANLAQVAVFTRMLHRLSPHLWGAGGDGQLSRSADLWRLLLATCAGAGAGALVGPTAIWLTTDRFLWTDGVVWFLRNGVSILLIVAVGLRLGHQRARGWRWTRPSAVRLAEYAALVVCSLTAYGVGFGVSHLPLAFPLLAVTVWAALRLHTTFVVLHDLGLGALAVLFTLHGNGPFASIPSHATRALVAQAFVGMIAVVGLSIALGRDERAELMGRLTAAGRETEAQARLLTTIVNSMNEGVSVVRPDHSWIMRNPAAVALMGGVTSGDGTVARPDHYGLFHPDGTPLPPGEMAHIQALGGHDVRGQEVLIRNAGVPEGRILQVSATRLPSDETDEGGAVVVFHDVTAERRHRDELSSFAGVVAHDLLNPLTTIDGWAENLGETLHTMPADDPAVGDAGDSLVRITRASARMRHLINDLLAYTTARNAAIAPVDVALDELVTEVTNARTDLAAAAGTPRPGVRPGPPRRRARRSRAAAAAPGQPRGQRGEVHGPGHDSPHRHRVGARRRRAGAGRAGGQRHRHPARPARRHLHQLPPGAPLERVRGHGPRPRDLQAHRGAARRDDPRRRQPGRRVAVHLHAAARVHVHPRDQGRDGRLPVKANVRS